MKITRIQTSNFIGARAVDIELRKPVAMITGKNGAGKSSIRDAIALAFTADLCRVSLKKEAATLISEGGESCFVEITTGTDTYGVAITVAGKISDTMAGKETPAALPYVLDAQRFSHLNDNERRAFLFGLMDIKLDGPAIKKRLLDKGFDGKRIEQIMPILRAGFDAASKEAASRARDAKASWKTVTGGETWGKDKAGKWQPPAPEISADKAAALLAEAKTKADAIDADLAENQRRIGEANATEAQRKANAAKRAELNEKAERARQFGDKLATDEANLAALEKETAALKAKAVGASDSKASDDHVLVARGLACVVRDFLALDFDYPAEICNRGAVHLSEYAKLHGEPIDEQVKADPDAAARLPEYEKGVALMRSAVENGRRNLADAMAAGKALGALGIDPQAEDISLLKQKSDDLATRRKTLRAEAESYQAIVGKAQRLDAVSKEAAGHHADVMAWIDIADALAPDGIPAELLAEALGPINEHLRQSAANAEWEPAQINADMGITYGLRNYAMISESEKWRVDAMIAETVAHISGLKLLVLDRFDVLDTKGREDLLYWLDGMAEDGDIDTALIFGTLKSLPAQLLPSIDGFWIDNGTAGQMKEAA